MQIFQRRKDCPFAEISCKLEHNEEDTADEDAEDEDAGDEDKESQKHDELEDNLCFFCNTLFETQGPG